jgi:hypothetical protein
VTAADSVARSLGISLGMPATKARALVAKLIIQNADAGGGGGRRVPLRANRKMLHCEEPNPRCGICPREPPMRHRSPGKLTIMCDADRPNGRIER